MYYYLVGMYSPNELLLSEITCLVFVTTSKTFVEIRVARARASTFCSADRRAAIFPRTVALQKKSLPEYSVAVDKGVNIINGLSKDPPTY